MKTKIFLFFLLIHLSTSFSTYAQNGDKEAVISVVQTLFDGMRAGNAEMIDTLFLSDANLISISREKENIPRYKEESVADFVKSIKGAETNTLDEKIWSYDVNIHKDLATVWTDYTFYYKRQMSHCGVNSFTLHRTLRGWKILNITDTRTRKNCQTDAVDYEAEINTLMDAWHHAAAVADEDVFFGSMSTKGIYIGTDKTELWKRDEMKEWSKKYFERESAWAFTATERNVYFSEDKKVAWFDEKLDTWMGVCRASGVLEKEEGEWKISHYHLAVTIDNDLVEGFLTLTGVK